MTAHQLARQLLAQEDLPVFLPASSGGFPPSSVEVVGFVEEFSDEPPLPPGDVLVALVLYGHSPSDTNKPRHFAYA